MTPTTWFGVFGYTETVKKGENQLDQRESKGWYTIWKQGTHYLN